jgi:hypothetical protein
MSSSAFLTAGIGAVVAALGCAFWRARVEAEHLRRRLESATTSLEQLQLSFARFAPQEVVERIITSGVSTIAEKKTVTVLFADIVGFTALSERMEPALLVQIVNGYLARMSRAIAEHRGHVSKFIGDGILALFGALEPNPWQADDAVRAALATREALEEYNKELAQAGQPALRVGIGLHRGVAVPICPRVAQLRFPLWRSSGFNRCRHSRDPIVLSPAVAVGDEIRSCSRPFSDRTNNLAPAAQKWIAANGRLIAGAADYYIFRLSVSHKRSYSHMPSEHE